MNHALLGWLTALVLAFNLERRTKNPIYWLIMCGAGLCILFALGAV